MTVGAGTGVGARKGREGGWRDLFGRGVGVMSRKEGQRMDQGLGSEIGTGTGSMIGVETWVRDRKREFIKRSMKGSDAP